MTTATDRSDRSDLPAPHAAALTGHLFVGATRVPGTGAETHSADPRTGRVLAPAYRQAGSAQVSRACALAEEAFDAYRAVAPARRARFLERIADNLADLADALVDRAGQETGLPHARLTGEVARTTGQLRLFADVVREGSWHGARIDLALPERQPVPRPDLRQRQIPLGPVAVFGASNFPLAFLGGRRRHRRRRLGDVLRAVEGQLTATVHAGPTDLDDVRRLLPVLERRAGRIVFDGWPTGVEVGHAMVHGGPFPATSDPRATSVGSLAIERFLRPVAYQNAPRELLPAPVGDGNPCRIPRRVDGTLSFD
ncbi:aldehyde dehydrogenase family protein [Parafrankia sp. EUN1f]|uniref:aldehyde dehydrogenase family protein n=1 Tax=Parafrankia sp. EUN1f TaxID=102897 RepID=UPI0001C441EE|nr:aldehyde dehydrogenase family protein [Parafrankia sp. EUN1f]EFC86073.1 NAD-dependent aldehyde dehydrogenase-like protein [Parafrankia sp. EUN1f]